jgi:hypothetical protein
MPALPPEPCRETKVERKEGRKIGKTIRVKCRKEGKEGRQQTRKPGLQN